MKKLIVIIILALLASSCNYIIAKRDPAVLNSTIELSGEITGDIYPEVRTASMHVTGQAGNFLLVEAYGLESFTSSETATIEDSLAGNEIFLNIIDDGDPSSERCYRNLRFHVGPFEKDQPYVLHLAENAEAFSQDVLTMSFSYAQSINQTVLADSFYYLLSDIPFDTVSVSHYEGSDVPNFDYTDWGVGDTLRFFYTDSGLLIRSILEVNCDVTHIANYEIDSDTLIMNISLGPAGLNFCSKKIFFDYLIPNYEQQIFYYKFYFPSTDWAMFEGFYNLP